MIEGLQQGRFLLWNQFSCKDYGLRKRSDVYLFVCKKCGTRFAEGGG